MRVLSISAMLFIAMFVSKLQAQNCNVTGGTPLSGDLQGSYSFTNTNVRVQGTLVSNVTITVTNGSIIVDGPIVGSAVGTGAVHGTNGGWGQNGTSGLPGNAGPTLSLATIGFGDVVIASVIDLRGSDGGNGGSGGPGLIHHLPPSACLAYKPGSPGKGGAGGTGGSVYIDCAGSVCLLANIDLRGGSGGHGGNGGDSAAAGSGGVQSLPSATCSSGGLGGNGGQGGVLEVLQRGATGDGITLGNLFSADCSGGVPGYGGIGGSNGSVNGIGGAGGAGGNGGSIILDGLDIDGSATGISLSALGHRGGNGGRGGDGRGQAGCPDSSCGCVGTNSVVATGNGKAGGSAGFAGNAGTIYIVSVLDPNVPGSGFLELAGVQVFCNAPDASGGSSWWSGEGGLAGSQVVTCSSYECLNYFDPPTAVSGQDGVSGGEIVISAAEAVITSSGFFVNGGSGSAGGKAGLGGVGCNQTAVRYGGKGGGGGTAGSITISSTLLQFGTGVYLYAVGGDGGNGADGAGPVGYGGSGGGGGTAGTVSITATTQTGTPTQVIGVGTAGSDGIDVP